jgi:NAD(P)H dehydrogenase (quinone)
VTHVPRPGSDAAASDPGAAATSGRPAGARRVLVTGAGGKTGQAVSAALLARGVEVVGLVRNESAGARLRAGVGAAAPDALDAAVTASDVARGALRCAVGDQRRADDLAAAAAGCDAVYAIAPNMTPDEVPMARALLEACDRRGIRRVVYHSVLDPDEPTMPHHHDKARVEAMLAASDDVASTCLRPSAYQQNLAGYVEQFRVGRYEVPYDLDRPHAMVDLRDVAEVAADCLAEASHVGRALELAGPESLTARDIARIAGRLVGREVVVRRIDPDDWLAANGALPADVRQRLHAMFLHYDRHGFPGDPSPLRALLGREPGRLRDTLTLLLAR